MRPTVAIAFGLSAHAAAAGCLPALRPTLLALPPILLLLRLLAHAARGQRLFVRIAAGQAAVHAVLAIAAPCASHSSAGAAQPELAAALDAALTLAHVLVLTGLVAGVAWLERALVTRACGAAVGWYGAVRLLASGRNAMAFPVRPVRSGVAVRIVRAQVTGLRAVAPRGPPATLCHA